MSSWSNLFDVSTSLCAFGSPVIWVRNTTPDGGGLRHLDVARRHPWRQLCGRRRDVDDDRAGVGRRPPPFGFRTKVMVCGVTDAILNGPPDRSMAGSTVVHDGFHPTFSMMWAGMR